MPATNATTGKLRAGGSKVSPSLLVNRRRGRRGGRCYRRSKPLAPASARSTFLACDTNRSQSPPRPAARGAFRLDHDSLAGNARTKERGNHPRGR